GIIGVSKAQIGTGGVYGTIVDDKGEGVPFANVAILDAGQPLTGTTTNIDGKYKIKSIKPSNNYTIRASYVGLNTQEQTGVIIKAEQNIEVKFKLTAGEGIRLGEVVKIEYIVPLIEKDASAKTTITGAAIEKMPSRGAAAAVTTVAGVQDNDGAIGSIGGTRTGATDTYIDGVKVRGSASLPQAAYEQVTVLTGGIPAQYGDITGGVISITTKGASRKTYGGIELVSSGGIKYNDKGDYLFDPMGYQLIAANISGPLISVKDKRDKTGKSKRPILGYFLAGEVNYTQDTRPSPIGSYYVKEDILNDLRANPIVQSPQGASILRSELIGKNDLEWSGQRRNASRRGIVAAGNIDIYTTPNVTFKVGGNLDFNKRDAYSYNGSMFNVNNNGEVLNQTWRVYGRFTQRFTPKPPVEGEKTKKSAIGNAYYSIQADYSSVRQQVRDPEHKDELFRYGYVGKFTTYKQKTYAFGIDGNTGLPGFLQGPDRDTMIVFEGSDINPDLSAYTAQYYAQNPDAIGKYENMTQIEQDRGALRNGDQPRTVYNLWNNTGTQFNQFSKSEQTQVRVMATGSFDIKNHTISLGFEYEQRKDASIRYAPYGLWTITRQLANKHLAQQDTSNPVIHFDANGSFTDTVSYNPLYTAGDGTPVGASQSFVDYNMRIALGLDPAGTDWIDIDSYDPDFFDISMFSADELLNNGNQYVFYNGFDYTGKRLKGNPTFDDFFTEKDEFGNFTRKVAAFQPIYMAGYIQDEFTFKDLIFRVGVRVDRYDANQKVLKDPYLLYEAFTADEVSVLDGNSVSHPGNIDGSAVVYVNSIEDPTLIIGYRDGDVWFDSEGIEVTDPTVLRTGTGIAPYLINPDQEVLTSSSFKDYTPQVTVMPRISFSFPISDNALFYANYDVLSQRPLTGSRLNVMDYMFLENRNNQINNPNLKPSTKIEYRIGFKQTIGKRSAIELSASYAEMRNQIASIRITEAYPRTYTTLGNLDFGTVKGLTVSYDLRRTNRIQMRVSYTLQFADGTGSNATTGLGLINAGFPNLRVIQPLDIDQRHNFVLTADYRFAMGKRYKGPKTVTKGGKTLNWLQGFGVNAIIRAGSGNPYSRQSNTTAQGFIGGGGATFLDGSINGSSRPWTFRIDMRVDKDIVLTWKKEKDGKSAKKSNMTIYVDIQNLLNTKNVLGVYRKTGNPDDDGFLLAAEHQPTIAAQTDEQAFRDQYAVKINNPFNYSLPRRIRLGLLINF
ncbi:MAG: TonB-dependent receptor, partial [Flavobacteriales bacterium]|nr:TonB-dependent receptor [Flavobacteriales bacterium]